jgi:hypothetical protein
VASSASRQRHSSNYISLSRCFIIFAFFFPFYAAARFNELICNAFLSESIRVIIALLSPGCHLPFANLKLALRKCFEAKANKTPKAAFWAEAEEIIN